MTSPAQNWGDHPAEVVPPNVKPVWPFIAAVIAMLLATVLFPIGGPRTLSLGAVVATVAMVAVERGNIKVLAETASQTPRPWPYLVVIAVALVTGALSFALYHFVVVWPIVASVIAITGSIACIVMRSTAIPDAGTPTVTEERTAGMSPATSGTNSMAIIALITGVGFAPLGIIFGHIALSQIRRSHEGGRGLAIAGLVLGYVGVAVAAVVVIASLAAVS